MPSYSTNYRHTHPEYYQKEKAAVIENIKNKYATDPEFRQKIIDQAKARYKNPEYRQKVIDQAKARYNNPEYRQKVIDQAKARYARLKAAKQQLEDD